MNDAILHQFPLVEYHSSLFLFSFSSYISYIFHFSGTILLLLHIGIHISAIECC